MGVTVTEADGSTWRAPFCANEVENVECPACGDEAVRVQENSSADPRPAYCGTCHALLEVQVYETYGAAEVVDAHE